uniref:Uncharacterized protein n=1 Tax=Glossina brevipalpis TaxID=37001 RepID=A0A1A9WZ71_9MUSC
MLNVISRHDFFLVTALTFTLAQHCLFYIISTLTTASATAFAVSHFWEILTSMPKFKCCLYLLLNTLRKLDEATIEMIECYLFGITTQCCRFSFYHYYNYAGSVAKSLFVKYEYGLSLSLRKKSLLLIGTNFKLDNKLTEMLHKLSALNEHEMNA